MTTAQTKIVDAMRKIGTYKEQYMPTVKRLATMRNQYADLEKKYAQMPVEVLAGFHKPVIVSAMETLRRDILAYERDLGLTPAALKRIDAQEDRNTQSNALADALRVLDGGGGA